MERVTQEMKWRSLYLQLGMTLSTNASHALKQAYRRQVDLEMMPQLISCSRSHVPHILSEHDLTHQCKV